MLQITVKGTELFDEATSRFIKVRDTTLQLEHSLVSLSKWESKWKVHYLDNRDITPEMSLDYVRCMTVTQNVDPNVYFALSDKNIREINDYINNPMTATTFRKDNRPSSRQIVTAEIIYYWMVALGIPFEPCQKWHLNRLITLIRVCDIKNSPKKKPGRGEGMTASQRRSLNAARRAKSGSRG